MLLLEPVLDPALEAQAIKTRGQNRSNRNRRACLRVLIRDTVRRNVYKFSCERANAMSDLASDHSLQKRGADEGLTFKVTCALFSPVPRDGYTSPIRSPCTANLKWVYLKCVDGLTPHTTWYNRKRFELKHIAIYATLTRSHEAARARVAIIPRVRLRQALTVSRTESQPTRSPPHATVSNASVALLSATPPLSVEVARRPRYRSCPRHHRRVSAAYPPRLNPAYRSASACASTAHRRPRWSTTVPNSEPRAPGLSPRPARPYRMSVSAFTPVRSRPPGVGRWRTRSARLRARLRPLSPRVSR